jgi:tRNA pseudouridine55 synthase
MYSAVRYEGRRLYDLARQGAVVERTPRPIRVDVLRLVSWQDGELPRGELEVVCSKGTYIRTLCHDIGAKLGCGGHMSRLRRTRVGCWTLEDAWTVEDIAACAEKGDYNFLHEIGFGLELPRVELAVVRRQAFANGLVTEGFCQGIAPENLMYGTEQEKIVQVYCQGILLGIGRWQEGCLYPVKVMVSKAK